MNLVQFPELKKIEIIDFSLYIQEPTFTYEFVKGINLIIGGNGLGKTTFISLVKYGLIGNYTQITTVRTYKDNRIDRRVSLDPYYFRNRMNNKYPNNENAKIILTFSIGDTIISVTRDLYELGIRKVVVKSLENEYSLDGEFITQRKYDLINTKTIEGEVEKKKYLQYKYEELVIKLCNFSDFDSLIFFTNDILSFDEKRRTLFWDKEIQFSLLSKHFNPPELDNKIEELKREIKYFDSLARHKQEDIRAITKVLNRKESSDSKTEQNKENLIANYTKFKAYLSNMYIKKEKTDKKIIAENKLLKDLLSQKNIFMNKIASLEKELSNSRSNIYKEIWLNLNPKYELYLKNLSINKLCPLCNNDIYDKKILDRIENNKCVLCEHDLQIGNDNECTSKKNVENEMNSLLLEKQNIERNIINRKNNIKNLEYTSNETELEIAKTKDLIYNYQKTLESLNGVDSKEDNSVKIIFEELSDLEKEKEKCIETRDKLKNELDEKNMNMEAEILKSTRAVSSIFSEYASNFLGLKTKLYYDVNPNENEKMYIPLIDDLPRYSMESLSESQSFFIDQSFRFSIIDFFNKDTKRSAFYICETPDSSLDISYELNAADIFIKFSNKPNTFIITSNFNNSRFIEYIIKNSDEFNYLNLLHKGNITTIQSNNSELNSISERIEVMIRERHR